MIYQNIYEENRALLFSCCIFRDQNAEFKAMYAGCVGNNARSSTEAALMALTCAIEGDSQTPSK